MITQHERDELYDYTRSFWVLTMLCCIGGSPQIGTTGIVGVWHRDLGRAN